MIAGSGHGRGEFMDLGLEAKQARGTRESVTEVVDRLLDRFADHLQVGEVNRRLAGVRTKRRFRGGMLHPSPSTKQNRCPAVGCRFCVTERLLFGKLS